MTDVIRSDDLIEKYKLHRVTFPPPNFNLTMVSNISSNFPDSGEAIYVRGTFVPLTHP